MNFHPLCFITHQINPVSALRLVFVISCRQMLLTAEWSVSTLAQVSPESFTSSLSQVHSSAALMCITLLRQVDSNYLSVNNNDSIFKSQNEKKKKETVVVFSGGRSARVMSAGLPGFASPSNLTVSH